jgi:hypothetical protein
VILDGFCGEPECCGVLARIAIEDRQVVWNDFVAGGRPDIPDGLRFEFERSAYEATLADVMQLEPVPYVLKVG